MTTFRPGTGNVMDGEKEIKPRFVAVRINETKHWSDDIKAQVKAIHAHYVFDENTVTHCCEITPSYWLRWVGFDIETEDPHAEISEELHDAVAEGFHSAENSGYYHCRTIDKIADDDKKVFMEGSDLDPWSEGYGYDNAFDEVVDAYHANPVL